MEAWVRRHFRVSVAAVFAFSFLLIFLTMNRTLNPYDEGLVLVDAVRTLDGDVVHRDYYSTYAPASYYILALFFLFDPHWFILGRIYGITVMAGIVAIAFCLLVPRTRFGVALAFTSMCGAWMLASPLYLYPSFPSILLALGGSALLLRWWQSERTWQLFAAGMTAGAAALFRYDAGFFLGAAHVAAVGIKTSVSKRSGERIGWLARAVAVYALGTALLFLPFTIYYLRVAPTSAFIGDIIEYPVKYYAAMRALPFPRPRDLLHEPSLLGIYLPIIAALLSLLEFARKGQGAPQTARENSHQSQMSALIIFALLTALFYYKGAVRVSWLHMLMSIIPSLIILALLVDRWWSRKGSGQLMAGALFALAAAPPAHAAMRQLRFSVSEGTTPINMLLAHKNVERRLQSGQDCAPAERMTMAVQRPDYQWASDYIRRFSRPDEKIFVGLSRHDKIFANAIGLYFSSGRRPGTHWHHFDPGLQTRADIQSQIVEDLKRNRVRWIIRDASFENVQEPNGSSRSSGVHILDQYLQESYRPVAANGQVQVWLSKDVAAPQLLPGSTCM